MTNEIVGRGDALRVIDKFGDPGNALIVVGDPGLGKTTLLSYASRQWTSRGGRVLSATAVEFEADLGFAGLRQLLPPDALPDLSGDRLSVAESLLDRLRDAESPTLILVDDIQWLDRSSAAVLTLLARRLTGTRIGFLGSTRPEAEGFFERARLNEYTLTPLDEQASAEMLTTRHPDLSPAARRRVLALAAGNPLALVELPTVPANPDVVALNRRLPAGDADVVPLNRRLHAAFADRIAGLPAATRKALLLVALEATGNLSVLEAAAGERFLESVASAERARLIDVDGRVAFAHPLMRSAVVNVSTAAERRRAHRRLAEAVRDDPDRSAAHLARGSHGPDERAAAALEDAAYRLVRRGDTVGAVTSLTHAATLSPARAERARRLATAAYVGAHLGGGLARAEDTLREVRRLETFAGSLDMAMATSFVILNADGDVDTAHRLLAGALDTAAEPSFQTREALLTLLYVCFFGGRGHLWTVFDAHISRRYASEEDVVSLMRHTHSDPAYATAAHFEQLDRLVENLHTVADPAEIVRVALAGSWVDRLPASRAALHRALEQGRAADDANVIVQALAMLSIDAYFMGQWPDTERYLREAQELTKDHGLRLLSWATDHWVATLAAVRGDDATAIRITEDLVRWAVPRGVAVVSHLCHFTRALLALGNQDYERAYRELVLIGPAGTIPPFRPVAIWTVLDMVEAAVRTDRHAEARAHVTAATGLRTISPRIGMLVTAAEALVSDGDAASRLFDRALATPDADRWPFDQARVELLAGQHHRRHRARREAREHLTKAHAAFVRLGAATWAERARRELRATGQPIGAASEPALTERERLIAQLAARGLTNKEIGEELFLSARTVGAHLYRIFPKLGITSRAGLRDALTLARIPPGT
ncbi:AAA family ATPase [Actinoplanes sp. TBRC 11911]|uniref:LuxR C-terminal-related transcriptional regulator n=1 Tax=Actinoplanes sp. TBRC 11911 TaxID=2729386 RepID=UPI00145E8BB4|nr:LuxR family transcriptional regulator [Actinoplanes sp. TBRC 11911]NMO53671.1 AAA family ATPase [Actinoplanes sp. TBRC 11911]